MQQHEYDRSDFDLHGRVKQSRFHLPEPRRADESQHKSGKAAFDALSQPQRAALLGWLSTTIEPARPSKGAEWEPYVNVLRTAQLAEQATAALGFSVDLAVMRGAVLAAGYLPLRISSGLSTWLIGAKYKDGS